MAQGRRPAGGERRPAEDQVKGLCNLLPFRDFICHKCTFIFWSQVRPEQVLRLYCSRHLFHLQRRQIVTQILDAMLRGTFVVIVFEQRSPHRHSTRSVRRNTGSKLKHPGDIFVWEFPIMPFGQCREIWGGHSKHPLHGAVALSIDSMTCGAILFIHLPAGGNIVRRKVVCILNCLVLGACRAGDQNHACKQNCAVHNLNPLRPVFAESYHSLLKALDCSVSRTLCKQLTLIRYSTR